MQHPENIDITFEQFVQAVPVDIQELAYEFKAFTRARKIQNPLQLIKLVMLYCGLDLSIRSCAGEVAQMQGYISDTAVQKRLAACVPWVKALLIGVFGLEAIVESGTLRFVIIDGSTIQEPGAKGTTYRLHVLIDLINLTFRQIEVTTDKIGENLDHYKLEPNDVVLIDRGYNQPKTLVPFINRGGHIVLRYNAHGMSLYAEDENGNRVKINWEVKLLSLKGQEGVIQVFIYFEGQKIVAYIHAIPLPPEKVAEARRKTKQRAKENGREASKKALFLSEWVLILTSLPPTLLDTKTAGILYRVRWQVELAIKRLKSLVDIDKLRAPKNSPLANLYLYGKLLFAAVVEKIINKRFPNAATTMNLSQRQLTPWRLWCTVVDELKAGFKACFPMQDKFLEDQIKSLSERPRKRKLQVVPASVLNLMQGSQGF
jgi:hypothetical protein